MPLQVLLNDIMAMTRADSGAASSDSSQTQQHDLPCDANAGPSSRQALSAHVAAASPSLSTGESTAQHEQLQGNVGMPASFNVRSCVSVMSALYTCAKMSQDQWGI